MRAGPGVASATRASGGVGVETAATEGTTRSSAGTGADDRADSVGAAAAALSPSLPLEQGDDEPATPPRTASTRASTVRRRRQ